LAIRARLSAVPKKTRKAKRQAAGTPTPITLVVRRGALRRFHLLKKKSAHLPVEVVWDRRQEDRRTTPNKAAPNRRVTERRQKPPLTWELAEFVVAAPNQKRRKKRPRTKS
jgi:hypothetical protein